MHQADVDAGQREGSPRGNATSCESLKGSETPIVHAADTYSWMSPPNTSRRRTPTGCPLERPVGSCPSGVHGGSRGRARSPPLNGEEPNSDPRGPSESSSRRSEPDRRAEPTRGKGRRAPVGRHPATALPRGNGHQGDRQAAWPGPPHGPSGAPLRRAARVPPREGPVQARPVQGEILRLLDEDSGTPGKRVLGTSAEQGYRGGKSILNEHLREVCSCGLQFSPDHRPPHRQLASRNTNLAHEVKLKGERKRPRPPAQCVRPVFVSGGKRGRVLRLEGSMDICVPGIRGIGPRASSSSSLPPRA